MATPFDEIYALFLNEVGDDLEIKTLQPDLLADRLFNYLQIGIGVLDRRVYVDLDNRTDVETENYSFVGNGGSTLVLNPSPPTNPIFYITINDVDIPSTDYSFDSGTDTLTFTNPIESGAEVYVGVYTLGEFQANLNLTVKRLFKKIMQMAHVNYKKYREGFMNFQVYGKEFRLHSPANHLGVIQSLSEEQERIINIDIIRYRYYHGSDEIYDNMAGGKDD